MVNENGKLCIELDLNEEFVKEFEYLSDKYGEKFLSMNGFGKSNLNFSDFIDNFVDTEVVADVVMDSSAAIGTHDICILTNDMTKPHSKLLAFNKIFYEHIKKYGLEQAKKWLENEWCGGGYLHDAHSSSYIPYCFAYDLDLLVEKGLFFTEKISSGPAKHLTTFNDHVLEYIGWLTNRSSGAVGLPSYLVYSWYFWYKDINDNFYLKDPEYYRRQCFQKFV